MSDQEPLPLDVNMLTAEFRCSLARAMERATARLEELEKAHEQPAETKARAITAGSMAD
jgi:hypothetical protein